MDGFTINKKFFCKELGFLKVGNAAAQSFFFHIDPRWANLTKKDKKLCKYVKKHIHKLPVGVPPGVDALPLKSLKDIVTKQKHLQEWKLCYQAKSLFMLPVRQAREL